MTTATVRSHGSASPLHIDLAGSDHVRDGRLAPRWASLVAHAIALCALPAGLWRIALAAGCQLGLTYEGKPVHVHGGERLSILALSAVSELAALATLGLVRPWGERVPAWLPWFGGRRIPPAVVIIPSVIAVFALQVIWMFAFRDFPTVGGFEYTHWWWRVLLIGCYLPLLAWAPLLAAVTYAYHRRRCRD